MGALKRGSVVVALGGVLLAGLFVFAALPHEGAGLEVALAQAPAGGFYNVATDESAGTIPNPLGNGSGELQIDALCDTGDIAVGGGHIVHPSGTTGIFVTKSYATDKSGDFTPPYIADRWRVKVVHAVDPARVGAARLTAHVVCADVTAPFRP